MRFGTAKKNETATPGGDGTARWIKTFQKGETQIRFLQEMDTWHAYYEHFDQGKSRSFPCTGDRSSCPGCTSENERTQKAAKRYLVNGLVKGYVDLYKVPVSIISSLTRKSDADGGTIMAREYTIVKSGTGVDTEYDVEKEDRSRFSVEPHEAQMQDFETALITQYVEVWGPLEDSAPEKVVEKTEERTVTAPKPTELPKDDDNPPTEPQQPAAAAEEDEEVLSEDQLRAMSLEDLHNLFERCGVEVPETDDTNVLADALIAALS